MTNEGSISDETSKRICTHMNNDHAASVYGMVLDTVSSSNGISECKMKSISLEGVKLSFVVCQGSMCEMKTKYMVFDPPLKSVKDSRPRLIEIHHKVLTPKFMWLVTDPFAIVIIIACSLLGYGTYAYGGILGLTEAIEGAQRLNKVIESMFGSAQIFSVLVVCGWYFAVIAHLAEAIYVVYHAIRTLKLKLGSTFLWFYLTLLVGFPVSSRFLKFLKVHSASLSGADSNKSH